jgi:DNA-binding response OmpR family regulator
MQSGDWSRKIPPNDGCWIFAESGINPGQMKVFRSFRLDTVNHCLWRSDERVPLAPKAFDVLRYLVEHADRLVTQDEILEAIWPGTYVNPEVIKKYVLGIRKVLGDQAENPVSSRHFRGAVINLSPTSAKRTLFRLRIRS